MISTTGVGLQANLSVSSKIIGASFGITDASELSWLTAAYSLIVGTFILIFGRMGNVFGYKRLVVIGLGWYSLWSLVSGLAIYSNQVLFIFSRALADIGSSITLPNALAMSGYAYEPGLKKVSHVELLRVSEDHADSL